MLQITSNTIMARWRRILPRFVWLISCDGRACFKWSLPMVESYLPNIIARVSTGTNGLSSQLGSGNFFIGIMVEGVSSDVLTKIDEYMRYIFLQGSSVVLVDGTDWFLNFLSNLDADMMKKLKSETEERRVQLEAAFAGPSGGRDTPMQLLADCTANLCSMCVDQQPVPRIRDTRGSDLDTFLRRVAQKMREERGNEPGYFGNV